MMTDSRATFECKKHHLRQTNDGWIISLVVHPDDDMPDWLTKAKLGTPLGVAIVPIDYDNPEPPARKKQEPVPFGKKRPSEQAGMLCKDAEFQQFLGINKTASSGYAESLTADRLREWCGVASRADINNDELAQIHLADLIKNFRDWQKTDARYKGTPAYEKQRTANTPPKE